MADVSGMDTFGYFFLQCVLVISFGPFRQSSLCRGENRWTHEISTEPLNVAQTQVVTCRVEMTEKGLVGVYVTDVHKNLILIHAELASNTCNTNDTFASCFIYPMSHVILKAAITDLTVGETRTYDCVADYLDEGGKIKNSVRKEVTLPEPAVDPLGSPSVQETNIRNTSPSTHRPSTDYLTNETLPTLHRTSLQSTPGTPAKHTTAPANEHTSDCQEAGAAVQICAIDGASAAVGAAVTLVVFVLVHVAIFFCRRRRIRRKGLYPRHRGNIHQEVMDADFILHQPFSLSRMSSGLRSLQIRRHRPPNAPRHDAQGAAGSRYQTPAVHRQQQQVQRPLPQPKERSPEMTDSGRRPSQSTSQKRVVEPPFPLPPPARHCELRLREPPHESSPYDEASCTSTYLSVLEGFPG